MDDEQLSLIADILGTVFDERELLGESKALSWQQSGNGAELVKPAKQGKRQVKSIPPSPFIGRHAARQKDEESEKQDLMAEIAAMLLDDNAVESLKG